MWLVGNRWADYFAKLGALPIKILEGHAKYYKGCMAGSAQYAKYLARAVQRSCQLELWSEKAVLTPAPIRPPRSVGAGVVLLIHEHDLVEIRGKLMCRRCPRTAKTAEARRQLTGGTDRRCVPSAISRMQARLIEAAASSTVRPPPSRWGSVGGPPGGLAGARGDGASAGSVPAAAGLGSAAASCSAGAFWGGPVPAREGEAGAPVVAKPAGSASSASVGAVGGRVPGRGLCRPRAHPPL